MVELGQALADLRRTFLADPVVRFIQRHGLLFCGLDLLFVSALCVGMGLFSAWQVWDEALFAVCGVGFLLLYRRQRAWR